MKPQWTTCPCKKLVLVCISRQVKHSWTLSLWTQVDTVILKSWPNSHINPSQCKFAKPGLEHGLAMGGQTESQVSSQVHASRERSYISRIQDDLWSTCADFVGWADLLRNLSSTEVKASHRRSHKWVAKRNASRALVQNLHWPVSTCESVWPELKCREKWIKAGFSKIVTVKFCFASLNSRFASFHGRRQYTPTWRCTWICGQD